LQGCPACRARQGEDRAVELPQRGARGRVPAPGDGGVAYPPILAELARERYDGWLVVEAEQDPAKAAHPLTYATLGYRNVSTMARAAGLT